MPGDKSRDEVSSGVCVDGLRGMDLKHKQLFRVGWAMLFRFLGVLLGLDHVFGSCWGVFRRSCGVI